MARRDKLLRKIRNNPKNVSFNDLSKLLTYFDFEHVGASGSHHKFRRIINKEAVIIMIPYKRPHIKSVYVKDVLAWIDVIEQEEQSDD